MGNRIDVHSHYMGEVGHRLLTTSGLIPKDFPVALWTAEDALAFMDRQEIATQVLSLPFSLRGNDTDPDFPAPLIRELNETLAEVVKDRPDRFGAFATLPFNTPEAALAEIDHALDVLGLDGVALSSNVAGSYFGQPFLEPVLAELGRRQVPVFVHPIECVHPDLNLGRVGSFIEFPMDTARNITNAILRGVFRRHPGLNLILAHCGGVLPTLAWRITQHLGVGQGPGDDAEVDAQHIEDVLRGFHYETALAGAPHSLLPTLAVASADRLLFGTDYGAAPERLIVSNVDQLEATGFDAETWHGVERGNAERLFPRMRRP